MRILTLVFIRLACHYIYENKDLQVAYDLMKNEPEDMLDSYFKAWADRKLEDKGAVVTHYCCLVKLFTFVCSKMNINVSQADW